jgi:DNA primase
MSSLRDVVQQIKDRADLVEMIGRSVQLKRTGTSYKAKCPFHNEKTPSFSVYPAKHVFHCFGCGAGGSAIDWVMRTERLEFHEAARKLADELGIPWPESRPENRKAQDEERQAAASILEVNAEALGFFRHNLAEKRNSLANEFLVERGLDEEMVETFQLGASLDAWEELKRHLLKQGFSEDLLVKADLCVRSENGRVYDRFRNRFMFPIFDQNGKVVAFGGRQLVKDPKSGKYVNSSETPLYKKSNVLYGLNLAMKEIERAGYAILCEGYMDVIMAHAHGHRQAVAPLGTALTAMQARLLKRYANKVFFLYDGDEAGQKNMLERGLPLLESNFDVRVITLPPDDDPDTFLRREGAAALHGLMEDAVEFFDFAVRRLERGLDLTTLAGQAELAERLTPVITSLRNDVMREVAIGRLLRKMGGLPRDALTALLSKAEARRATQESSLVVPQSVEQRDEAEAHAREQGPRNGMPAPPRYDSLDSQLLKLMLECPEALAHLRQHLDREWVTDNRLIGWICLLLDREGFARSIVDEAEATGNCPGRPEVIAAMLAIELPESARGVDSAQYVLYRLQERHYQARTAELFRMMQEGDLSEEKFRDVLLAYQADHKERLDSASRHLRSRDHRHRRSSGQR